MSTGGEIVFLIGGVFALVSAGLTVSLRSPLRAAVALLVHIISLAGLYLSLHAHLLAALQVLVYAGAVVVLFVFVVMLIGPSAIPRATKPKGIYIRTTAAALMVLVGGAIASTLFAVSREWQDIDPCRDGSAECGQFGGVEAVANAIYTAEGAAVPFELLGILLLVAIVAAVAVARGHSPEEKRALEAQHEQARRDGAESAPPVEVEG